jgi:hypothetical protein
MSPKKSYKQRDLFPFIPKITNNVPITTTSQDVPVATTSQYNVPVVAKPSTGGGGKWEPAAKGSRLRILNTMYPLLPRHQRTITSCGI